MANVRPIRTRKDHKAALARLEKIWPEGQTIKDPEVADEFEILTILLEEYEQRTFPIAKPSPIAAIRFEMESHGLNITQIGEKMGVSRARAGEVLSGKRALSINMIRSLVVTLGMEAAVLIGDLKEESAA